MNDFMEGDTPAPATVKIFSISSVEYLCNILNMIARIQTINFYMSKVPCINVVMQGIPSDVQGIALELLEPAGFQSFNL